MSIVRLNKLASVLALACSGVISVSEYCSVSALTLRRKSSVLLQKSLETSKHLTSNEISEEAEQKTLEHLIEKIEAQTEIREETLKHLTYREEAEQKTNEAEAEGDDIDKQPAAIQARIAELKNAKQQTQPITISSINERDPVKYLGRDTHARVLDWLTQSASFDQENPKDPTDLQLSSPEKKSSEASEKKSSEKKSSEKKSSEKKSSKVNFFCRSDSSESSDSSGSSGSSDSSDSSDSSKDLSGVLENEGYYQDLSGFLENETFPGFGERFPGFIKGNLEQIKTFLDNGKPIFQPVDFGMTGYNIKSATGEVEYYANLHTTPRNGTLLSSTGYERVDDKRQVVNIENTKVYVSAEPIAYIETCFIV